MTTEKALREALTRIKMFAVAGRESAHGQCKNLVGDFWAIADQAEAALSLPETQGEPVAWMIVHKNCVVGSVETLESVAYQKALDDGAEKIVPLYAATPSQPAQGEDASRVSFDEWFRRRYPNADPKEKDLNATATKAFMRQAWDAATRAAPAAPTQAKPTNGEGA